MDPVVVTGIGLISSLGTDLASVREALRAGRSGIGVDPQRVAHGFSCPLSGRLEGFDARTWLSRKERRAMGEPAELAACAALLALDDAALSRDQVGGPTTGVILGNDSTVADAYAAVAQTMADGTTRKLRSGAVVQCMNSNPSINLSVLLGTRGACWTVSAACASGAHSIGQAWGLLATGQQDMVLCGGTQELHWSAMAAFDGLGAFSQHEGDPTEAVRPFSHDRSGLVPGGGAAVLVLERLSTALARGARVRAEILAYAFSSDGHHVTTPSGDGAVRCIRRALELGGLGADEVEYVNAHAAGTPVGDRVEAEALLSVFGPGGPPVSSTKSMTGHECWMAGASEVAYSLLMAEGGFVAPNLNYQGGDPGLEGLNVATTTLDTRPRTILSNSFGFGGTNATLLLRAPDDAVGA